MSLKLKVALSRVRRIIAIKDIYMKIRSSNNTKFECICLLENVASLRNIYDFPVLCGLLTSKLGYSSL